MLDVFIQLFILLIDIAYSVTFRKVFLNLLCCENSGLDCSDKISVKMSSHQANSNKPRSLKCCNFCLPFDLHNYCPSCREAGKVDDPCVTNEKSCNICSSFSEEQLLKIKNRRKYVWKQKVANTSKDELDLLGDDVEVFSGSQADLEGAAENLFSSPPRSQPLCFEMLSLKTPQTVSPTPGMALQNKIESKLEKSLGAHLNIQLQQQMEVFQAYSDASRVRDTRYLASFSTSPQFGIFGAFSRRGDPACLQNGGAPIVSRESFNFIIMKAIFGRFFSEKCYFI